MRIPHRWLPALFVTLFGAVLVTIPAGTATAAEVVVMAVGDIACPPGHGKDSTHCHDQETAALLGKEPALAAVLTLGDHQYETGTLSDFEAAYQKTWGAYKAKTLPSVGNHEYQTTGAAGYFDYFGAAAGDRAKGYYTKTIGDWRIFALNSNCSKVGGCGVGSPQYEWLKQALAKNPHCSLAFWHHPRYSSSKHGNNTEVDPLWDLLYRHRVEIVLAAHAHHYERFYRIKDDGTSAADGIRSFVVGTGGKSLYGWETIHSKSAARYNGGFGVLKLTLRGDGYAWKFVSEAGKTYSDSGSGTCLTPP